jgi:hypothetical protein
MILYQGWFDLKPGESDMALADMLEGYLGKLRADGLIAGWRLSRRTLGLGPGGLGEFHVQMELADLSQLDKAFLAVSSRRDPIESLHHAVNSKVRNVTFALYRDFPDAHRHVGEERF